jgi:hypothetical protein
MEIIASHHEERKETAKKNWITILEKYSGVCIKVYPGMRKKVVVVGHSCVIHEPLLSGIAGGTDVPVACCCARCASIELSASSKLFVLFDREPVILLCEPVVHCVVFNFKLPPPPSS